MFFFTSEFSAFFLLLCRYTHAQSGSSGSGHPFRGPLSSQALPVYSLATNRSLGASGSSGVNGATCSDLWGTFPCSCLALSITATIVQTIVGTDIETAYALSGPKPPDDCCDTCHLDAVRVRIFFWPVDDDNIAAQNTTHITETKPYTMVSNGFTFTSPSVYVAYQDLNANTMCMRFKSPSQGKYYNTTVAYKPDVLSTSRCVHGFWEPLNYTQMQYPPPNTLLTDCYLPGGKYAQPSENPNAPTISPNLSFPSDLSLLLPSWKSCTYAEWGLWDPPSTLGKATAMVAASTSSPSASPGAQVSPVHAPATPTPDPKDPEGDTTNPAASAVPSGDPGAPSGPFVDSGLADQQGERSSYPLKSDGQESKMTPPSTAHPPTNDPPSKNDLSFNDGPSSIAPSKTSPMANDPSNNGPTKSDPSSGDSPSSNDSPSSDHRKDNPPANDPQRNSEPSGNNAPIDNTPSTKDPPSNDNSPNSDRAKDNPPAHDPQRNSEPSSNKLPINNNPSTDDPPNNNNPPSTDLSKNDLISIMATSIPASPLTSVQPQDGVDRSPSSAARNEANSMQSQNLGAQIASAFGYVPGSTASPVNNPNVPNADPKPVGIFVDGTPTPVIVGESPVQKVPNGAVLVAGQTVAQGSQATVSRAVVSVGSNNVVVDGTNYAFSSLAPQTLTPLMVGAHTAQRVPNGGLVVASQTFAPGAQATVAGILVSVGNGKAILDGTTRDLAPIPPTPLSLIVNGVTTAVQPGIAGASGAPVVNIGGQAMTLSQASPGINIAGQTLTPEAPHQGSPFIIAGETLTPGGAAITVSGIPVSLPTSPTPTTNRPAMAIEASASQTGGPMHGVAPVIVGTQVFTPNPSAFAIAGTTISAGGPGITVAGTVISLQPSGAGLLVGSSTLPLAASEASPGAPTPITIGSQVFTPNPSAFAIAGTTISAGGPGVTVVGTFISLQPSAAGLVVGSSTNTLPSQSIAPNVITIGTQIFTPNPTGFSIASTTLSAGAPGVTVDGTVVSLMASGAGLVLGSSTIKWQGTGSSVGSTNADWSSGAASTTSSSAAGDTSSISSAGSVISTPSGEGTTANSQPTRAVSAGEHTQSARGRTGALVIVIASILALIISTSI